MNVRMKYQGLAPCVTGQYRPRDGPKVFLIAKQFKKGVSYGPEKKIRHHFYIQQPQVAEFVGKREYTVIMITGKKPGLPFQKPPLNLYPGT